MQKRSLQFAIFKWIAVCMQLISCSNGLGIRWNGSSYLLKKKKIVSRSNGSVCPCKKKIAIRLSGSGHLFEKNCQLFEWLDLSVQNKIVLCWNSSGYLFEKNCQPFEQLGLSVRKKLATVQKLDPAICLKKNLGRFPSQNNFLTSHLCRMICYSPGNLEWSYYELCLQTYHE